MNPGRDALILVLIIVGLIVVSSGLRSIENSPGSEPRSNVSVPIYSPKPNVKPSNETAPQTEEERREEIEDEIVRVQAEIAQIEQELENIEKYGEESPFAGMVKIRRNAGSLRTTDASKEYITLEAQRGAASPVSISGWKLTSAISGIEVTIPDAVHLVFSGNSGSALPVALSPGDRAYVLTGRSPIGLSFRVNKCSGYYTQFQKFIPSISTKCGDPSDEILNYERDPYIFIDNTCMDYVDRMPKCRVPTKQLPVNLSYTCQEAIVDEINYGACIENHKDDEDFKHPDWRLYLKRDSDIWRNKRELIKLLDESGKTVDHYSY